VEKGETLKDTLLTLDAYGPDVVVIRHAEVGAAALATRYTRAAVVNAGDGAHQHPTQSLLDLYTMRAALGRVEGVHVAIVGDVLHSRVARSNLALLLACGARVTLVGPPSLIPRGIEATGVAVSHEIGDIAAADVVYVLRMQRERMLPGEAYVPSLREYTLRYGITSERLRAGQVVMHPGPMNRGVEISDEVADSAASLVTRQVRAGLVVRMAVLYDLLAGPEAAA
jgi:aspartate carbamoyltransferase catalytic subunit